MFHIAICDDDAVEMEITKAEVLRSMSPDRTQIDLFLGGAALLAAVENGTYVPDITILDINMPELNGIEVAKKINDLCPRCRIIFLTSYLGYATDVYEARHSYFVLKSEIGEKLKKAFGAVFADIDKNTIVSFRADGEQWKLGIEGILYLERNLRKVNIVCRRRSFTTSTKLEELFQYIPDGKLIHCHQSYWVNPDYIRSMTADSFIMADETVIPISRGNRESARNAFFTYLHSKQS